MALYTEIPLLIGLFQAIEGVARVTEGWPLDFKKLPCIAIEEASNIPARFADDAEYMTEIEYYIRVFTLKSEERRTMADAVDDIMTGQGYTRSFAYDSNEPDIRYKALRYNKTIGRS